MAKPPTGPPDPKLVEDFQLALREVIANVIVFSQRAADSVGLNSTDLMCICVLQTHGPMPAGELGRRLGLSSAAVTAAIDRVERHGYARRISDPTDRRRVLVELVADRVEREVSGPTAARTGVTDPDFLSPFSASQLRAITEFLKRLSAGLDRAEEPPRP